LSDRVKLHLFVEISLFPIGRNDHRVRLRADGIWGRAEWTDHLRVQPAGKLPGRINQRQITGHALDEATATVTNDYNFLPAVPGLDF
jgi:hypothetical protein